MDSKVSDEICPQCFARFSNFEELLEHSESQHYTADSSADLPSSVVLNKSISTAMHCRVEGCTEAHSQHYCKSCKKWDSDHFNSKCPLAGLGNTPAELPSPPPFLSGNMRNTLSMPFFGTQSSRNEELQSNLPANSAAPPPFLFRNMRNTLSMPLFGTQSSRNEASQSNAPANIGSNQDDSKLSSSHSNIVNAKQCRVEGCTEQHSKHICRNCKNSDSDHFTRDCPVQGAPLVGTVPLPAGDQAINAETFQPDTSANEGPNISVSTQNTLQKCLSTPMQCRVQGCTEAHSKHYCRSCKKWDVDHFSSKCPVVGLDNSQTGLEAPVVLQCRVAGCTKTHSQHTCRVCKQTDSDHSSSKCPNGCKAEGCYESHKVHYCWVCEDTNSDHKSVNCQKRFTATLYHGTLKKHSASIEQNGIRPSRHGILTLGSGVYFATTIEHAKKIAQHQANKHGETEIVVVQAICNLGNMFPCPHNDGKFVRDYDHWQQDYDSCLHKHGKWVVGNDFREVCIKDPGRCRVEKILQVTNDA